MSTTEYVARQLGVDTSVLSSGATVGTIVGGDTALDTNDGDTSYVLLARDGTLTAGTEFTEMPFEWQRVSGPVPNLSTVTSLTVTAILRRDDSATPATSAFFSVTEMTTSGGFVLALGSSEPDTYVTKTSSPLSLADAVIDGRTWRISPFVPDTQFRLAGRITYLRIVIESGTPYLRQRNRDTARARNRASRQRGIRQRGYL